MMSREETAPGGVDSTYAWVRLAVTVLISSIGGVGLWSMVVTLPTIGDEFGVPRADASMPYTVTMICMMLGGVPMGRLADRYGIVVPTVLGTLALGAGYVASSFTSTLWQLALVQGVLIAVGCSATFAPLVADVSHWFRARRGVAVAIAACGSYLAGTVWPPIVQHLVAEIGWRQAHLVIGVIVVVTILPLVLVLRRPAPAGDVARAKAEAGAAIAGLGMKQSWLSALLVVLPVLCCIAMAMPQVHIVAYCAGLGYGPARGAEMLSVMLGTGAISRLASGWIADRIGGPRTMLLGSVLQALSLLLYLPFDGLVSLYLISGLFGLSQGGIVPSYAILIRQYFPPAEAATRVAVMIGATLGGMAIGGWMSGALYDLTGSYQAAFANGFAWNLLHAALALWLVLRAGRATGTGRLAPAAA